MEIKRIDIESLAKFPNRSVYASNIFLELYKNNLNVFGIFNSEKLIGYFFTSTYKRKKFYTQLSNPVLTPNCGLTFELNSTNNARTLSNTKKILKAIASFLETRKESIISISFPYHINDMQPFIWEGYKAITLYTYLINLQLTEVELLANMSTERRKNIKRAIDDKLTVKQVNNSKEALDMVFSTYKNQGKEMDFKLIENIMMNFANQNNSVCNLTYNANNELLACNFCLYDNNKMTYVFGGYNKEKKHEGAGALGMWHSIKQAKEKKNNTFDFSGSMIPAIEKYFRGFGGEITPYYNINKASYFTETLLKIKDRSKF
jgi:hypothetical protein